jgi:hypothetical protein
MALCQEPQIRIPSPQPQQVRIPSPQPISTNTFLLYKFIFLGIMLLILLAFFIALDIM